MDDLSTLTTFLGWTVILNIGFLLLATLIVTVGKDFVLSIHGPILGLPDDELNRLYINALSNYKMGTYLLSLVPYLALKIMGY
jgi:hypothetical protein